MDLSKFIFSDNFARGEKLYLYNYNNIDFRLVYIKSQLLDGYEKIKKYEQSSFIPQTEPEEITRISLSRTKRNIRELALCNNFEYFVTLTVNSNLCDRYSLTECQSRMKKLFKSYKRKNKGFAYLFITEKHKDGAFHFHGLMKNIDLNDIYINQNGYYSSHHFDLLGFNSFSKINDYSKTCNYILKYITKDCIKNESNQIYFSSRGLLKASREEVKNYNIDDFEFNFKNDFCFIKDFNINDLSKDELLKLYFGLDKK